MTDQPHQDAIALLKDDHRKVEELFEEFDKERSSERKAQIVEQICTELKIHMQIEEEIFYPSIYPAINKNTVNEGFVEHDGAKTLINDLEALDPSNRFYDAKVKVLSEEIKHHVAEEERWVTGMFAQAKHSELDMDDLGARLSARKLELQSLATSEGLPRAEFAAV